MAGIRNKNILLPKSVQVQPPKKGKVFKTHAIASNAHDRLDDVTSAVNRGLNALTTLSRQYQSEPPLKKAQVAQFSTVTNHGSYALNFFGYILTLIDFICVSRNRNLEKSANLGWDTVKTTSNIFGVLSIYVPEWLKKGLLTAALTPVIIIGSMIANFMDFSRNLIRYAYNMFHWAKTFRKRSYPALDSEERKDAREFFWTKSKEHLGNAMVDGVFLFIGTVGMLIPKVAVPISYFLFSMSCAKMVGGVSQISPVKNFIKKILRKIVGVKEDSDEKNKNKPKFSPKVKNYDFRKGYYDINGLKFKKADFHDRLIESLDELKVELAKYKLNAIHDAPTPTGIVRKVKDYGKNTVPKLRDGLGLLAAIGEASKRMGDKENSIRFHNKEISAKREDKYNALQDLHNIVLQLIKIIKNADKTTPQVLFLSIESSVAFRDGILNNTNPNQLAMLTFTDFHENKDQIWETILHYFEANHPGYANAFFKETGDVKALFNSVEMWMKQKSIDEINQNIAKLETRYQKDPKTFSWRNGPKFILDEKDPGLFNFGTPYPVWNLKAEKQINKEKLNALSDLRNFMDNIANFNDFDANNMTNKLKQKPKHVLLDDQNNQNRSDQTRGLKVVLDSATRLVYVYDRLGVPETKIRDKGSKDSLTPLGLDLSNQQDRNLLIQVVVNHTMKRYPGFAVSVTADGDVANAVNDGMKLIRTHSFANLGSDAAKKAAAAALIAQPVAAAVPSPSAVSVISPAPMPLSVSVPATVSVAIPAGGVNASSTIAASASIIAASTATSVIAKPVSQSVGQDSLRPVTKRSRDKAQLGGGDIIAQQTLQEFIHNLQDLQKQTLGDTFPSRTSLANSSGTRNIDTDSPRDSSSASTSSSSSTSPSVSENSSPIKGTVSNNGYFSPSRSPSSSLTSSLSSLGYSGSTTETDDINSSSGSEISSPTMLTPNGSYPNLVEASEQQFDDATLASISEIEEDDLKVNRIKSLKYQTDRTGSVANMGILSCRDSEAVVIAKNNIPNLNSTSINV